MNTLRSLASILTLHRVYPLEPGKLLPNENMKISPEFLENFIVAAKKQGYTFISLDALYCMCREGEASSKNLVITLDDGYADNYTHAYPVFKRHDIPFAIYVTSSFADKTAVLWWYSLEDLIVQNDEILLSDGAVYPCKTVQQKNATFLAIREKIISLGAGDFQNALNRLFYNYRIDWQKKAYDLALNWEQIKSLSEDPLVTIGNHTVNHRALNRLSQSEVIQEISGSQKIIESHLNKKVEHFCYPFGSKQEIGEREFDIVRKMSFKTATTTRRGNIYTSHKNRFEALPRIMLTHEFTWPGFRRSQFKDILRHQLGISN